MNRYVGQELDRDRKANGVVPSQADLQAAGTRGPLYFGVALIMMAVLIGTMVLSGDASAFFGH